MWYNDQMDKYKTQVTEDLFDSKPERQIQQGVVWDLIQNIKRMVVKVLALKDKEKESDPQTFQDLLDFKKQYEISDKVHVAYVGCGSDPTVQDVFSQTINLDLREPVGNKLRNFVKGSALSLPFEDGSMDIIVQQAISYAVESDSRCAQELSRALSTNGKIFRDFPALEKPHELAEALEGLHYLLILKNYHKNGLIFDRRHSYRNATFTKGVPSPEEVKKLDEQIAQYSEAFFLIFEEIPLKTFEEMSESPFLVGKWAYHTALEFVLGIDLHSDQETISQQLEKLRSKLKPETLKKIQLMVTVLKRDLK